MASPDAQYSAPPRTDIKSVLLYSLYSVSAAGVFMLIYGFEDVLAAEASKSPEDLVGDLNLPKSISPLEEYGEYLTIKDLEETKHHLLHHKEWIDNVVEEYKWVLTTDPEGVRRYNQLVATQKELSETLTHLEKLSEKNGEFDKIQALMDKLKAAGTGVDRVNVLADTELEKLKISGLREVKENLLEIYRGAAQVAQVPERGYVFVDGAPVSFEKIYGVKFANSDETEIPRRAARAFFEFKRVMLNATGQYPVIVEGHTGDLDRPTSGKHQSIGHLNGTAADIVPKDFNMSDEKVYQILMGAKGNPYFCIKYEPGSPEQVKEFINSYSERAVEDRYFTDKDDARKWFTSQLGHGRYTTGRHFHVVALGGLGPTIDPNGPSKQITALR